jgi:hypothetical protein
MKFHSVFPLISFNQTFLPTFSFLKKKLEEKFGGKDYGD